MDETFPCRSLTEKNKALGDELLRVTHSEYGGLTTLEILLLTRIPKLVNHALVKKSLAKLWNGKLKTPEKFRISSISIYTYRSLF